MAGIVGAKHASAANAARKATGDPVWVKGLLIGIALGFLALFLVVPLVVIFVEAFSKGANLYFKALTDPDAQSAIRLTLTVAVISVVANVIFGLASAWAITKFHFRFKGLLITLIDLPFAISPVVAGLIFVTFLGTNSLLGGWITDTFGFEIIFAVPGIILATMFVTFPFVARELIPLMEEQGTESEQAALVLGASGWQTFWRVTLPNVKWALLYGVILCNARAMGEFGAVSVVSGHIRGKTNTIPLHVEILFTDNKVAASFAVASLLVFLALVTLVAKSIVEWRVQQQHKEALEPTKAEA